MLTVKEINEVSFGKAGFSGYKPEDVDNFIDEVAASFQQLEAERNNALKHAQELTVQNSELSAKNAEIQEKLAILAKKVESYREDEDGIKDVLLSAQRLAKDSVQEAKDKAAVILQDAQDTARKITEDAKSEAEKATRQYMLQTEVKKEELEEMKRQVSAFRASLLEMYKKHLECINHIPNFRQKEKAEEEEVSAVSEEYREPVKEEPVQALTPVAEQAAPQPEKVVQIPKEAPRPQQEPVRQPAPAEQEASVKQPPQRKPQPAPVNRKEETSRPTLHDRVDYTVDQRFTPEEEEEFLDDDLSDVGIDLKTYSNIPETLKHEKESHFSHLEFGDDVDLGKKKRKK